MAKKVFSKAKWLASANAQKATGILTQKEIDYACEMWVDAIDGKTADEITAIEGSNPIEREDWFVTI